MATSAKKKILAAVDQSPQAAEAVRYLGSMLSPQDYELVLFHVAGKIPDAVTLFESHPHTQGVVLGDIEMWEKEEVKSVQDHLDKLRSELIAAGWPAEAVQVKIQKKAVGYARDIMIESRKGYHAVALGRRGLSPLKDFVLGSLATKLASHLHHLPVWVVGGAPRKSKLLLGLDGSGYCKRCAEYLVDTLKGRDLEVCLVHVVRSVEEVRSVVAAVLPAGVEEKLREEAVKAIEPIMAEASQVLTKGGFKVTTKFITDVSSVEGAIVDLARAGGYQTIVLGRRGLSLVEEFMMGRVSDKTLSLADQMAVWVIN